MAEFGFTQNGNTAKLAVWGMSASGSSYERTFEWAMYNLTTSEDYTVRQSFPTANYTSKSYTWYGLEPGEYLCFVNIYHNGDLLTSSEDYEFTIEEQKGAKVFIYSGGAWHEATPYVYSGGAWKEAAPYIYSGGWKP